VPSETTLYHLSVPLLVTVPDKVNGPASHLDAAVAETTGTVVNITAVTVDLLVDGQPLLVNEPA
jgi:hypothetical protein